MEPVQIIKNEKELLARLFELRSRIYTSIAQLQVEFSPSAEPVIWEKHTSLTYRPLPKNGKWADVFGCAWFRLRGQVPPKYAGSHVVAHIDIGGEGLVYSSNSKIPVGALSMDTSYIDRLQAATAKTILPIPGTSVSFDIDASFNGYYNHPAGHAYFKCAELCLCDDEQLRFYYDYLTCAMQFCCEQESERKSRLLRLLEESYMIGKDDPLQGHLLMQDIPKADHNVDFIAVGHSHLDLAWLWPLRETRRKACRTFAHQIGNLEHYPAYIYGASQPQQFQFVKESHPGLYEYLKHFSTEGRLECQGAMWVEADANLTSGEALIRQILYGKRFFRNEFGQEAEICWLPDSFGFNGNLPQILSKSGIPYFLTTKLSWNEHNPFPYRSFIWEGIDGSRVLAHMPPGDTYNAAASPPCVRSAADNYPEKSLTPYALMLYGIGDGGGGPGEAHLEMLFRQDDLHAGTAISFFRQLQKDQNKLPVYSGELYLEKHQGTYTTQGFHKRSNRQCETGLQCLEALSVWAWFQGIPYPKEALERMWKLVLLLQFHDILPGSSIHRVYEESRRDYISLLSEIRQRQYSVLSSLSDGSSDTLTAFNPAPFTRKVFIRRQDQWFTGELPPLGCDRLIPWEETAEQAQQAEISFSEDGSISSIKDHTASLEWAGDYLNRLILYEDPFLPYNAWDIDEQYETLPYEVLTPVKTEIIKDGPLHIRRHLFQHGKTTIRQDIFWDPVYPVLYFRTFCHWAERLKMLRADFAPSVFSDSVTCDIQMGCISRSTRDDDPLDRAQFEICAHKFVDISDKSHGISLLNDGKYGHRVKNGKISLNLLRSTILPDPEADQGEHVFTYALLFHMGPFGVETVRQSYFLNRQPLTVQGNMSPWSMARTAPETVILETVKMTEEGDGIILRLYESVGKESKAKLTIGFPYSEVWECDTQENILAPANLDSIIFHPFELKTLLLR